MQSAHRLGAVEIDQRARDPERAVPRTRREAETLGNNRVTGD